jgi:hypothetical protein
MMCHDKAKKRKNQKGKIAREDGSYQSCFEKKEKKWHNEYQIIQITLKSGPMGLQHLPVRACIGVMLISPLSSAQPGQIFRR